MTDELERRMRAARRRPLFDEAALAPLGGGRDLVERLIPHRGSMLLVDELSGLDLEGGRIAGRRHVAADDPVFEGHFPGDPVYPGALLVEAVGQCGLCLPPLRASGGAAPTAAAAGVRLIRILGADFVGEVRPGADATLLAELVDDGLTLVTVGQVLVDGRPTCVCAFEAMLLDEEPARA